MSASGRASQPKTPANRTNGSQGLLPGQRPIGCEVEWEKGTCRVVLSGLTPALALELRTRFRRVLQQLRVET
jgi:hypothetical protein